MKDIIVIDLDGTLANVDHRTPLIRKEKPDWDGFYGLAAQDRPNHWCVALIRAFQSALFQVVIVTARVPSTRVDTEMWLDMVFDGRSIPPMVMVRAEGDFTADHELKKKWLQAHGKDRILFVVDDRQRVVDMWRAEGVTCLQCAAWEEYKRPPKEEK
jgi:hypothetical protein